MKVNIQQAQKDFRKNGHTMPYKKSKCYGVPRSTMFDNDDENQVWLDWIQYLHESNIHDYNYLIID